MTINDFIRMAHEAGWQYADGDDGYDPLWRFAALVAAAERKSCIDDCNAEAATEGTAQRIIQRICARGQE